VKKKYTKDYMLSIRVAGTLIDRIDDLTEHFSLDRADLIRMLLSNALKFWEQKFNSTDIPQSVDKKTGYTNQVTETEAETVDVDLEEALKQLK